MSKTQKRPIEDQTNHVAEWPRITAVVHEDATGTLTINGTQRPCAAAVLNDLRQGISARCVAIAQLMGRPIRLTVIEGATSWTLGVRPEGYIQALNADGTIDAPDDLTVDESPCRECRAPQPITSLTCSECQADHPHLVEITPHEGAEDLLPPDAQPLPTGQGLQLILTHEGTEAQDTVTVAAPVMLGRKPIPVNNSQIVELSSPKRTLSRSHVLLELDEAGHIRVTDQHSGNGTFIDATPPVLLSPDQPHQVRSGATLLIGDVICTIKVV